MALLALALAPAVAQAVVVFSEGLVTPESISEVPAGFGTLGGDFLIPDARAGLPTSTEPGTGHGRIWRVPAAGGPPSKFVDIQDQRALGGLFLPSAPTWGAAAGHYLVAGFGPPTVDVPRLYTVDPDGNASVFVTFPDNGIFLTDPVLAPVGFGDLGGSLLVSAQGSGIRTVAPDGTVGTLIGPQTGPAFFGLTFAPAGFGSVGGQLLAGDAGGGDVWSVAADGTRSTRCTSSARPSVRAPGRPASVLS
jgi:hypothetical protein